MVDSKRFKPPVLKSVAFLIAAAAMVLLYLAGVTFVDEAESTVAVNRITGKVALLSPGRAWRLPLLYRIRNFPDTVVVRLGADGPVTVTSREALRLGITAELRLRLDRGRLTNLVSRFGLNFDTSLIAPAVEEALRKAASGRSATEIYFLDPCQRVIQEVSQTLSERFSRLGVEVSSLAILRLQVDKDTRLAIESHRSSTSRKRVWLIGWDGADWDYIRALLRNGRMPNFQRLIRRGASGAVHTLRPILSPLIWTSIATGRKPLDHGILDFVVVDPKTGEQVPTTSHLRKVKALWNIVGEHGKTVGVLGWLVTWPAEPVNGWLVSDRYFSIGSSGSSAGGRPASQLIYPESLQDSLNALVSLEPPANGSSPKGQVWKEAQTRRFVATSLLKDKTPDLAALYFSGVDRLGHLLLGNSDVPLTEARQEIEAMYTYLDTVLGQIVQLVDTNTTIIVASDHGFYTPESGPSTTAMIGGGHASEWHRDRGILVLKGPGIRPGATLKSAHVLDIAPTVLALLDLPVPADLSGRVLREALTDKFVSQHPVDRIDTYEVDNRTPSADESPPLRSQEDSEIRRRLESLGYLNPETANSYNNLGLLYRQEGAFEKAITAFQRAIEMAPDVAAFYDNLGVAYGASGDFAAAIRAHQKALALDPNFSKAYNNLGNVYLEQGNAQQAVAAFEKAIALSPRFADAYANLGNVYYRLGDFPKAERLIRKALSIEPGDARSRFNLAVMYGEQGRPQAAIDEFRALLAANPDAPMAAMAHNGLGVAHFRQGHYGAALKEFQKAARLKPNLKGVHGRMGLAYFAGGDLDSAKLEFQTELSLDPENEEIAAALRALKGMQK